MYLHQHTINMVWSRNIQNRLNAITPTLQDVHESLLINDIDIRLLSDKVNKIEKEVKEIQEMLEELPEALEQMNDMLEKLWYAPGAPGYQEAKDEWHEVTKGMKRLPQEETDKILEECVMPMPKHFSKHKRSQSVL